MTAELKETAIKDSRLIENLGILLEVIKKKYSSKLPTTKVVEAVQTFLNTSTAKEIMKTDETITVTPFGSAISGLSSENSDIDLCIQLKNKSTIHSMLISIIRNLKWLTLVFSDLMVVIVLNVKIFFAKEPATAHNLYQGQRAPGITWSVP